MAVLLVLYEIPDGERRSEVLRTLRRRHGIVVQLTETATAFYTPLLPLHVFDTIKAHLQSGDRLYVIPLTGPYTAYAPRQATEWLSTYLTA